MSRHTPVRLAIVGLMALGSVAMWVLNPIAWIWGVAQLADSTQLQMGQVLAILAGTALTMAVLAWGLSALDRVYGHLIGSEPPARAVAPWRRSLRDGRAPSGSRTVLEIVMVCSVGLALLALAVWFVFLARGGGLAAV